MAKFIKVLSDYKGNNTYEIAYLNVSNICSVYSTSDKTTSITLVNGKYLDINEDIESIMNKIIKE